MEQDKDIVEEVNLSDRQRFTDVEYDLGLATIATWLILPVVIRSSQRLSHACVSINDFIL